MSCVSRDFPEACVLALGAPNHEAADQHPWEWLLRELGAVHVACSRRDAAFAAEVVRRHLARFLPPPGVVERILADLNCNR